MIKSEIICLKKAMILSFHRTYDSSVYTLKFLFLDHVVEDLKIVENLLYWTLFPSNNKIYIS